jgi:hypothetical protein
VQIRDTVDFANPLSQPSAFTKSSTFLVEEPVMYVVMITARGRDQLRAMPVALRHTLARAFARGSTDRRSQLCFDQLPQRDREDVAQRRRLIGIGAEQTRGKVG